MESIGRARVNQLKTLLKNSKKGALSIKEFLQKIKRYVEALSSVGSVFTVKDHEDAILVGLSDEYNAFVTSINSRADPYTVEEI